MRRARPRCFDPSTRTLGSPCFFPIFPPCALLPPPPFSSPFLLAVASCCATSAGFSLVARRRHRPPPARPRPVAFSSPQLDPAPRSAGSARFPRSSLAQASLGSAAPASASAAGGGAGASGSGGKPAAKRVMKTPYQLEVLEKTYTGSRMIIEDYNFFGPCGCLVCHVISFFIRQWLRQIIAHFVILC